MFNIHENLRALVWSMFLIFLGLTAIVAYYPAYQVEQYEPLPDQPEMTPTERRGLNTYVAEGCAACHTQQVRNIEMDQAWGSRPAIPEDYKYSKERIDVWRQSPSLLGSERTGPDLTNVGNRQGSEDWQYLHLFEPRAVVEGSIMPSYRWLFKQVDSAYVRDSDVVVKGVPDEYLKDDSKKVVATEKAQALVAYLLSLKQPDLPEDMEAPEFIPLKEKEEGETAGSGSSSSVDGASLYESTCATCHQNDGTGTTGVFPTLKGSGIVNNDNAETHIKIIIEGKDDNPEYGPMQPFGDQLSDEEIAAIVNYERTSWGNDAAEVTEDDVKEVREALE